MTQPISINNVDLSPEGYVETYSDDPQELKEKIFKLRRENKARYEENIELKAKLKSVAHEVAWYEDAKTLAAENEELKAHLKKANSQTEHFEREWYLRGDKLETLAAENIELKARLEDYYHDTEKLRDEKNCFAARVVQLEDALKDMLGGWKYIREVHGDLYGVGWDRAQEKAEAALSTPSSAREVLLGMLEEVSEYNVPYLNRKGIPLYRIKECGD